MRLNCHVCQMLRIQQEARCAFPTFLESTGADRRKKQAVTSAGLVASAGAGEEAPSIFQPRKGGKASSNRSTVKAASGREKAVVVLGAAPACRG